VLRPHLSEFQRRLWLGVEAAELGPGGVAVVAAATGVAADTVRRGRKEAEDGAAPAAGRPRLRGGPANPAVAGSVPSPMTRNWCGGVRVVDRSGDSG
jgi:hypothetical protein